MVDVIEKAFNVSFNNSMILFGIKLSR